jgi:hypothetical protein
LIGAFKNGGIDYRTEDDPRHVNAGDRFNWPIWYKASPSHAPRRHHPLSRAVRERARQVVKNLLLPALDLAWVNVVPSQPGTVAT